MSSPVVFQASRFTRGKKIFPDRLRLEGQRISPRLKFPNSRSWQGGSPKTSRYRMQPRAHRSTL